MAAQYGQSRCTHRDRRGWGGGSKAEARQGTSLGKALRCRPSSRRRHCGHSVACMRRNGVPASASSTQGACIQASPKAGACGPGRGSPRNLDRLDSTKVRRCGVRAIGSAGRTTDHAGRRPGPASRLRYAVGGTLLLSFRNRSPHIIRQTINVSSIGRRLDTKLHEQMKICVNSMLCLMARPQIHPPNVKTCLDVVNTYPT